MMHVLILPILLLLALSGWPGMPSGGDYAGSAPMAVRVKNVVIEHEQFAISVMPGELLTLDVLTEGRYETAGPEGMDPPTLLNDRRWSWSAPADPGAYPLTFRELGSQETLRINVLVMVPFDHSGQTLNGFQIGRYETRALRGDEAYERPRGFIEVTPDLVDLPVSPNFRLGQFLCKQKAGWPKYIQLRELALVKLEMVHDALTRRGIPGNGIVIMSAFRTPYYNKLIGNRTSYSRHLYGGAVDFYVDNDDDGRMDDLNGDGSVDRRDATFLADLVGTLEGEADRAPLAGGLATYGSKSARGSFVHMDVRGVKTRW